MPDPTPAPATQSVVVQPSAPTLGPGSVNVAALGEWAGAVIAIAGALAILGKLLDRLIGRAMDTLRRDVTEVAGTIARQSGDIRALQTTVVDFMPRSEIEQRDGEVKRMAEQACRETGDLRVAYGRLDQRVEGLATDLREHSVTMRDRLDKLDLKLDRLLELFAGRG